MSQKGAMKHEDCNTDDKSDESHPGSTVGDTGSPIRYQDTDGASCNRAQIVVESITARSRRRCEWAKGPLPSKNDSAWVCENKECPRIICRKYWEVRKAQDDVQAAKESLKQPKKDCEEAMKACEEAKKECEEAKKEHEKAKKDQPGALSESGSNKKYLTLLEERVRDKEERVRDKEERVRDKEELLQIEEELLLNECDEILSRCEGMNGDLLQGSQAGNQTDYQTAQTNAKEIESEIRRADDAAAAAAKAEGTINVAESALPYSPSSLHKALNADSNIYPIELPEDLGEEVLADLQSFYKYCDKEIFREAVIAARDAKCKEYSADKKYKDCINKTCEAILTWKRGIETAQQRPYYRPSPVAQEVHGTQPIIFALLWKINDILGGHGHLTGNQYLPKNNEKSKRWMDAMWSQKVRQHLRYADGNLMEKPIECKPISRKKESFSKLIDKGSNQVIGHIFQVLYDSCFQFCNGLGRDGEGTGLVATLVSAKVISVRLKDVATATCNLKAEYSANVPLFSAQTTSNLVRGLAGDTPVKIDLDAGKDVKDTGAGLSAGFIALITFLRRTANFDQRMSSSPFDFEKHLGSGAFSSVYSAKIKSRQSEGAVEAKQIVIKLPKSPTHSVEALKRELHVLMDLSHASIPKLFEGNLLPFTAWGRCETTSAQCLALEMQPGRTARDCCGGITGSLIQRIFKQVTGALKHAHGKGWCHLDVQPSNIVLLETLGEPDIVLIDWGCAAKLNSSLTGYRGTPPFSHPSLLVKEGEKSWGARKVMASLDLFSFALTICYLLHGKLPWHGFERAYNVQEQDILDRLKIAKGLVEDSKLLGKEPKDTLLSMLLEESKGFMGTTNVTTERRKSKRKRDGSSNV